MSTALYPLDRLLYFFIVLCRLPQHGVRRWWLLVGGRRGKSFYFIFAIFYRPCRHRCLCFTGATKKLPCSNDWVYYPLGNLVIVISSHQTCSTLFRSLHQPTSHQQWRYLLPPLKFNDSKIASKANKTNLCTFQTHCQWQGQRYLLRQPWLKLVGIVSSSVYCEGGGGGYFQVLLRAMLGGLRHATRPFTYFKRIKKIQWYGGPMWSEKMVFTERRESLSDFISVQMY